MGKTVYEILGISATDDFKVVRRAFYQQSMQHHPDKFANSGAAVVEEKTLKIQEINAAYEQVSTQEKLQKYFANHQKNPENASTNNEEVRPSNTTPPGSRSNSAENVGSDALRVPRTGMATVYIPIPIRSMKNGKDSGNIFYMDTKVSKDPEKFRQNFSFEEVARVITTRSSKMDLQVGLDFNEASDIENQHTHSGYSLIAEVTLSFKYLSEGRTSEKKENPGQLNAGKGEFFLLEKGTVFTSANIASIKPMVNYSRTQTWNPVDNTPLDKMWPHKINDNNEITFIEVKNTSPMLGLNNSPTQKRSSSEYLRISDGSPVQHNAQEIRTRYTSSIEQTKDKESKFNANELQDIRNVIAKMEKEISSKLVLHKDRKQEKINALKELIQLSKNPEKTISQAINQIEKKYPNVREGVTSRVSKLLDKLQNNHPEIQQSRKNSY